MEIPDPHNVNLSSQSPSARVQHVHSPSRRPPMKTAELNQQLPSEGQQAAQDAAAVVKEAAEQDGKASVETWGPDAFARRIRTKLHNYQVPIPHWVKPGQKYTTRNAPTGVNIILLGPTGAGKSSLIYTWWRALTGSLSSKGEFFQAAAHQKLLQRLSVGWTADDLRQNDQQSQANAGPPQPLTAAPKHGTAGFDACELQAPDSIRGTGGISVHDTKGQQFFSQEEERFAEQLLQGKLKPGSTLDRRTYRYWFMLGHFGFFNLSNLASAPHVLVLVFDVTLRSFHNMLREGRRSELAACYRRILNRAQQQGHEVFAALTHIDVYKPEPDDDHSDTEGEGQAPQDGGSPEVAAGGRPFDLVRDLPQAVDQWRDQLSRALADDHHSDLSPGNIYAIANYSRDHSAQDAELDLAALEFLDSLVEAGTRYISRRQEHPPGCSVS